MGNMGKDAFKQNGPPDFDYLPPPNPSAMYQQEDFKDKFLRKAKANPFVPAGLIATTMALSYGLWQMKSGNKLMSQKMMRARIAAQGFTIAAIMVGVVYGVGTKSPDKVD